MLRSPEIEAGHLHGPYIRVSPVVRVIWIIAPSVHVCGIGAGSGFGTKGRTLERGRAPLMPST